MAHVTPAPSRAAISHTQITGKEGCLALFWMTQAYLVRQGWKLVMWVCGGKGCQFTSWGQKTACFAPETHTLPYSYHWPSTMGCSSCSRVCLLPQQLLALMVYSCPGQGS